MFAIGQQVECVVDDLKTGPGPHPVKGGRYTIVDEYTKEGEPAILLKGFERRFSEPMGPWVEWFTTQPCFRPVVRVVSNSENFVVRIRPLDIVMRQLAKLSPAVSARSRSSGSLVRSRWSMMELRSLREGISDPTTK
jgi:hypothetical protein